MDIFFLQKLFINSSNIISTYHWVIFYIKKAIDFNETFQRAVLNIGLFMPAFN